MHRCSNFNFVIGALEITNDDDDDDDNRTSVWSHHYLPIYLLTYLLTLLDPPHDHRQPSPT